MRGSSGAGVVLVEESLPLQVGGLDEIAVENSDAADASAHQQPGGGRANRAAAYNHGTRGKKAPLAFFANSGEEHLTRVLFLKRIERERARCCGIGHRPS